MVLSAEDYAKWGELIYQWVRHSVERYGKEEVESWYWEVWNEPDISYWRGTPEEYCKLYDYAVKAVKRALPAARVGGPATTGPGSAKAAAFLRQFLEHCERNASPLDFVSFHAKGRPKVVDGRVQMGTAKQLNDVARGLEILAAFPKFRKLPVVLSESDPEGCAACSARTYPQNAYRNTTLYPANTAVVIAEYSGTRGAARGEHRGHPHLGLRIRGPALVRRLPDAGHQRRRQAGAERVPHAGVDGRRAREA